MYLMVSFIGRNVPFIHSKGSFLPRLRGFIRDRSETDVFDKFSFKMCLDLCKLVRRRLL